MTDVIFVRTTERRSYTTCRQQWWWSFIDRLEAMRTKPALRFGGLVHAALAERYPPGRRRGPHPAKTFERLYAEDLDRGLAEFSLRLDDEPEWVDALELGIAMLNNYIATYGKDDHVRVIAPEFSFQVPMTDRKGGVLMSRDVDGKRKPVVYVGTFDMLYEDMVLKQFGVKETKTAASIRTGHLTLDEQAGSYWAMAPLVLQDMGILLPGQDIDFIEYDFLRKAKPDDRTQGPDGAFLNKDGTVSKRQPPAYFLRTRVWRGEADRANLMYRIRAQAWEMGEVRAGKLPVYKSPGGTWPNEQCNGCEFRDMCQLHETGSDWEELRNLTMTTWDPYMDHADYIEET